MQIDFAPGKDAANRAKHGFALSLAAELDWDTALVWIDDRADNGKIRMVALIPKSEILFLVAFINRDSLRRIISLRKANRREI